MTLRVDISRLYKIGRDRLMDELKFVKNRIALTWDSWTPKGMQYSFMAVFAIWIDAMWNIKIRLLRFPNSSVDIQLSHLVLSYGMCSEAVTSSNGYRHSVETTQTSILRL
ncbi:hypothetical protein BT69DRAFT_261430 [Atractiella rhizophila]|nr:hypothetical protein BT69DRAFT_261430 [Atractiella rhizophila]